MFNPTVGALVRGPSSIQAQITLNMGWRHWMGLFSELLQQIHTQIDGEGTVE
jgi:hypothetical protein